MGIKEKKAERVKKVKVDTASTTPSIETSPESTTTQASDNH